MIHSGLVNQRRGGYEQGYPFQRNNHPRDQTIRPWVSGFDLPVMEKSAYATPSAPTGSTKIGVPVKASAEVMYKDIFGKTASPDVKFYLAQLVKRVARGGGAGGLAPDGGNGPTGMGGGQRPTADPSQGIPPGQLPPPQTPNIPPQTPNIPPQTPNIPPQPPVQQMPQLIQESVSGSPNLSLGDYNIADLEHELDAEVEFEDIFYDAIGEPQHSHTNDVTPVVERKDAFEKTLPKSLLSKGKAAREVEMKYIGPTFMHQSK